jgi:hypothetical protein
MAITKRKLIYDLWETARGGSISDDDSFSERLLSQWIDDTRSELIRRAFDAGQSLNPDIIFTIPCLNVIQISNNECPCDIQSNDCLIQRTELQLPTTVETKQRNLIIRVASSIIGNLNYSEIPFARIPFTSFSKFGKNTVKWFLHNRFIYILSPINLEKLTVQLIPSYPEDLASYTDCSGSPCYTVDSYYPISSYMINALKERIREVDIKMFLATAEDKKNNAENDPSK